MYITKIWINSNGMFGNIEKFVTTSHCYYLHGSQDLDRSSFDTSLFCVVVQRVTSFGGKAHARLFQNGTYVFCICESQKTARS